MPYHFCSPEFRTIDSQGAEGVVRAGLEVKGQKVSKQGGCEKRRNYWRVLQV